MYKKLTILALLFVFMMTSGFGCKTQSAAVQKAMEPVTLTYWRVWDDSDSFSDIIKNYNALHPNIRIEYRKFRYEEYEKELLNAMAEDRGPDIYSIPANWLERYRSKIQPMPEATTLAYPITTGTLKKETTIQMRTNRSITLKELKSNFVDAVYKDVVKTDIDATTKKPKEYVYGLPLFMDTMVMFYNKDLFNNAGIAEPPAYWNKTFQQYVQKLTKQNTKGEIIQSGVALGGSTNVSRAPDILAALMLQNGATIIDDNNQVMFAQNLRNTGQEFNPGIEALRFYIDFANPAKEVYTWNDALDNSLTMFEANKLAMMFGYAYQLETIRADAPKLNFGIAHLPQIENSAQKINIANYWVETVAKKSKYKNEAWDFVQYATKADQAKTYLAKTNKPTALRSLVQSQIDDMNIGVFADQVLTARSWYKGQDASAAEQIMNEMVEEAAKNGDKINEIVSRAAIKVQQTIK
jgi:multiple sugar transport system substrate-binding protein